MLNLKVYLLHFYLPWNSLQLAQLTFFLVQEKISGNWKGVEAWFGALVVPWRQVFLLEEKKLQYDLMKWPWFT